MTLDEVTLDPTPAVGMFINRAVVRHIDSPVTYAFDGTWPVRLSHREAQEVLEAVEMTRPSMSNIRGNEHKELAQQHVHEQIVTRGRKS